MNRQKYASLADIQLPVLVLIFLLCLSVLLPLFSACWEESAATADKNRAVQLCRSAAETFAAVQEEEEISRLMGGNGETSLYYDSEGAPCSRTDASLILSIHTEEEPSERGVMYVGRFTAIRDGSVIYELSASRYVSEAEEARHG